MSDTPIVVFERVREHAKLPEYQTEQASGMDLAWASCGERPTDEQIASATVSPGGTIRMFTGLRLRFLSPGYEIQVRPRSGLAFKHRVTILNGVGTIDADYRGEIGILLVNHGRETWTTWRGDRVAQAVVCPVARAMTVDAADADAMLEAIDADEIVTSTRRGAGGFGSTGR